MTDEMWHNIMQELRNKQKQVTQLTTKNHNLIQVNHMDADLKLKKALRASLWKLESRRMPVTKKTVAKLSPALLSNSPGLLYLMGCSVPLPVAPDDNEWPEAWRLWLENNRSMAEDLFAVYEVNINLAAVTTTKATFEAKAELHMTVMPMIALQWWNNVRAWADLPPWMQSPNKIYH